MLAAAICTASLSIGVAGGTHASASPAPTISAVTFTAPPGDSLDYPGGISANNGTVYVSNTFDNVVASIVGSTTTTIAGSYEGVGETGDGGPATAATLDSPAGTATDRSGDLFIADTEDNVIRKITSDGIIHLVAGNGTEGYRGDGGPGTQSEMDNPQDVAVNSWGDVFIADTDNNVIREVSPFGRITTYAGNGTAGYSGDGGPATRAELTSPTGVAVDSLGNLYIADAGNNVIRRVSLNGAITTVAGDYAADQAGGGLGGHSGDGGPATNAQLNSPEGVAVDRSGDLFIADTFNDAVREVAPNGVITTVVNTTGAQGSSGNGGPATAAELNTPYAVAVDNSTGDAYIADTSNSKVRVVTGLPVPGWPAGGPTAPSSHH
jgi:secreted PhoX family phosphatase